MSIKIIKLQAANFKSQKFACFVNPNYMSTILLTFDILKVICNLVNFEVNIHRNSLRSQNKMYYMIIHIPHKMGPFKIFHQLNKRKRNVLVVLLFVARYMRLILTKLQFNWEGTDGQVHFYVQQDA